MTNQAPQPIFQSGPAMQPPPPMQSGPPMQPPAPVEKNVVGTIALVMAIIGFIFACIPGALVVGWILLPIAFILAIVGLVLKNKTRKTSIAALIVSIVGTIVGILVFIMVVGNALDDALNQDVTAQPPAVSATDEPADSVAPGNEANEANEANDQEEPEAEIIPDGTRTNPFPIGTELRADDWTMVINSVDLDATDAVMAENDFNDPPEDGNVYILVNITMTYMGTDEQGEMPWATIEFVNAAGNTFDALTFDSFAVAPDSFDEFANLYEGASTSGNKILQVPASDTSDGVLAVSPSMFAQKVFVAVQ